MPRLVHKQDDPLSFLPLEMEKLDYIWEMLQQNLDMFDDYTPFNKNDLETLLFGPSSISFEIGDGVGVTTLVIQGTNAWVQMVMWDWKFRDYICRQLIDFAFSNGLVRLTSTVTEDRRHARDLVTGLGFKLEGCMRKAFHRGGRYLDVEIYGLTKEDYYGSSSSYSRSGDRSSRDSRRFGDLGASSESISEERVSGADEKDSTSA